MLYLAHRFASPFMSMVPAKHHSQKPGHYRRLRTMAKQRPAWPRSLLASILLLGGAALPCSVHAASQDESLKGPDIVIIAEEERTIFEFRQGGELRMVRIVPRFGKPYYLVPRDQTKGFGNLERADMLLPSWVIVEF